VELQNDLYQKLDANGFHKTQTVKAKVKYYDQLINTSTVAIWDSKKSKKEDEQKIERGEIYQGEKSSCE
jgi:hypothetical protein